MTYATQRSSFLKKENELEFHGFGAVTWTIRDT